MKKAALMCGVVIVVAAATFLGFSFWAMNAPAVPRSKLASLQPGMSQAEVRQLLGEPGRRYTQDDGSASWAYSRGTWAILYVYFDAQGKLTQFVHDE